MPVPTNVLIALNGVALATTATTPPDLNTLALLTQIVELAVNIPPAYLAASTSTTKVLTVLPTANGTSITADSYGELNRQVATPPLSVGM